MTVIPLKTPSGELPTAMDRAAKLFGPNIFGPAEWAKHCPGLLSVEQLVSAPKFPFSLDQFLAADPFTAAGQQDGTTIPRIADTCFAFWLPNQLADGRPLDLSVLHEVLGSERLLPAEWRIHHWAQPLLAEAGDGSWHIVRLLAPAATEDLNYFAQRLCLPAGWRTPSALVEAVKDLLHLCRHGHQVEVLELAELEGREDWLVLDRNAAVNPWGSIVRCGDRFCQSVGTNGQLGKEPSTVVVCSELVRTAEPTAGNTFPTFVASVRLAIHPADTGWRTLTIQRLLMAAEFTPALAAGEEEFHG